MLRIFTTAAILALTITAAQAGSAVTVQFGDLDLTRASDAQALASRVHSAAVSACASEIQDRNPVSLHYRLEQGKCVADISQTISAKVMAMAGHARKFAGK